jgi:hypothetical protein
MNVVATKFVQILFISFFSLNSQANESNIINPEDSSGIIYMTSTENKTDHSDECVILLHGLVRSNSSMDKIEDKLLSEGYQTVNHDYPSTDFTIADLAMKEIPQAIEECNQCQPKKIHFVTHSLGGILIRYFLEHNEIEDLGRVVMLSPPNQGSEAVDGLSNIPGFDMLNGPAGDELGTDENSVPLSLGSADFEVGIITGNETVNLILSQLIPGEDDGKVSVESAKLEGMTDFLVVPHSHTFIMKSDRVIEQILCFLDKGSFEHSNVD